MSRARSGGPQGIRGYSAMSTDRHPPSLGDPQWGWQAGRGPGHKKPKVSWTGVAERLRAGEPLEDLAVEFGRTVGVMAYRLNEHGWDRHGVPQRQVPKPVTEPRFPTAPTLMEAGACASVDPALFYPEHGNATHAGFTRKAQSVCGGCEVRAQCLAYALEHDEQHGIWGGLTANQRQVLKKSMRKESA